MRKTVPLFPNLLEPKLENFFTPLCQDIPENQVKEIINQVSAHREKVRSALRSNEFVDIAIAEKIARVLTDLLVEMTTLPEHSRLLVAGAARYFIRDQDAQSDFDSVLGFDDDVAVLNHVLVEIGRGDLKVEF